MKEAREKATGEVVWFRSGEKNRIDLGIRRRERRRDDLPTWDLRENNLARYAQTDLGFFSAFLRFHLN